MASIDRFRAALQRRGGVARQHRWQIVFNLPAFAASAEENQDLSLMAITSQTPVGRMGEIPLMWGGRTMPFPGDREFDMLPVTFIATESHFEHDVFERWAEAFNGSITNVRTGELTDLLRNFEMQLLDGADNVVKTYTLEDCWPQEVGQIELDQQAQNTFGQFTVNLRFFQARNAHSR